MRILLLGEYSGFFKNLKIGFKTLGHDVTLMSQSDGWKKIDGMDISLDTNKKGLVGKVIKVIKLYASIRKMRGYDVVIIINPDFFKFFIFEWVIKKNIDFISANNKKTYLSVCGGDYIVNKFGVDGKFRYWPNAGCDDIDNKNLTSKVKNITYYLANKCDGIIPTCFDYAEPWRHSQFSKKVLKTIAMPIDTKNIDISFPELDDKVVFFHGLNKECHKGTSYIVAAMKNIKLRYPEKIDIIIDGKMPLDEYLQLLNEVHVVIDQCKAYSYSSMNSLHALSMGKVVLANLEKECLREFELTECPVVRIEPNVQFIERQMEHVIKNKHSLLAISKDSRALAESKHDSVVIAKIYIELFSQNSI